MKLAVVYDSIEYLMTNLRNLMQSRNISEAELARKTNIPQPTLHKILSGKTSDPRASTLKSLADFFGISIDELLNGNAMTTNTKNKTQSIPIISWIDCIDGITFIKNLIPSNWNNWIVSEFLCENAYAIISKPSMEHRFPKGTVLIIDPNMPVKDGDLALVHYPNTKEATLRELSTDGPTKLLLSICSNVEPTNLDDNIKILGVLIKSVFSYH